MKRNVMIGCATVWLITSFVADQDSSTLLDLTAPTVLPLCRVLSCHCTVSAVLDWVFMFSPYALLNLRIYVLIFYFAP